VKLQAKSNTYELVWRFRKQTIMKFNPRDGFFHPRGKARGVLVRHVTWIDEVWYHLPEDYLNWKDYLNDT
jgi:hypothetical protein